MRKDERKVLDLTPTVQPTEVAAPTGKKKGRMQSYEFSLSFDYLAKEIFGKSPAINARSRFMDLLRNCADLEIRKVVTLWDSLPRSKRSRTKIEELCEKANVDCRWLVMQAAGLIYELGADVSKILVSLRQPDVLRKTVERALEDDGHHDRKVFLQGSGFLPAPTTQFGLMVNNQLGQPPQQPAVPQSVTNLNSIEEDNAADPQFGE